ncbi:aminoadipic semialdehyde synthase, partial [Planoprotostelium fungivorum]
MSNKSWVLGIRREDKNRWERRAPVGPSHVKKLIEKGIRVIVQPSTLRTYPDTAYQQAGAEISDDLSDASTIIAVKEVPNDLLMDGKTYVFFSHTIKAQHKNMEMLDCILQKNIRLLDYEVITDDTGSRLVRFGKFAGYAGTVDTLHALGDRLLALGHSTPFLHLGYSYCYNTVEMAKSAVTAMGEEISNYGLPQTMVPFTFLITSEAGNVSRGSQEIMKLLPHKIINHQQLQRLVKHPEEASPYHVYLLITTVADWSEPKDPDAIFDKQDYYAHPEKYRNTFYEKYAPHITCVLNCMYWDTKYPRLIDNDQMTEMYESGQSRLVAVGDITCDPMGSIEALIKTTSIDQPCFVYDPSSGEVHDAHTDTNWIYKPGVLFCAVDNFPTEFPKEATEYFGDHLMPFLEGLKIKSDVSLPFDQQNDLPPELHKAVITAHGELTPNFKYISEMRKENEKSLKNFLILGAGFVSIAALSYLSRNSSYNMTVADNVIENAEKLVANRKNCTAALLDVSDTVALEALVAKHNIVISLIPAHLHIKVAQVCLKLGRHMVTTSYISAEMQELNEEAKKAGLIFLNETGLDPGLDHMEAKRVIKQVTSAGGKIRSFVSWCGGLPMPEASMNPFGYKFSWSPRGVLVASTQPAKYIQESHVRDVSGDNLFSRRQQVSIFPGFSLEGIPNRDSTKYIEQYELGPECKTFFRGTLRYTGVAQLGLLDPKPVSWLAESAPSITWNDAVRKHLNARATLSTGKTIQHILRPQMGYPDKGFDDDQIRKIKDAL